MYHIFFIQFSVDGHLGCFHVLPVVNSAAMNIRMHVSFQIMIYSRYMPEVWLLYGSSIFIYFKYFFKFIYKQLILEQLNNMYLSSMGPLKGTYLLLEVKSSFLLLNTCYSFTQSAGDWIHGCRSLYAEVWMLQSFTWIFFFFTTWRVGSSKSCV